MVLPHLVRIALVILKTGKRSNSIQHILLDVRVERSERQKRCACGGGRNNMGGGNRFFGNNRIKRDTEHSDELNLAERSSRFVYKL